MTDSIKITSFLEGAPTGAWSATAPSPSMPTDSLETSARLRLGAGSDRRLNEHNFGIDIRRYGVTVRVVTLRDDMMGMTQTDLDLARPISAAAGELGLTADPSKVQSLLIVPGAPNRPEIMPFWQAVLGYMPRPDSVEEDLIDPYDRGVAVWVEEMDEPRPGGLGAIHLAVWLPVEEAQARVDAALAAGGHLVRDDYAPAWWTLADRYGNEVDVATIAYRDEPPPTSD